MKEQPGTEERRYRYRAVGKLGGGSFGDILAAVNEEDPEDWKALKIEASYSATDKERRHTEASMVRFEDLVYHQLARRSRDSGIKPFPAVDDCISLYGEHDVLVMELLGPNLRDYATDYLRQWPLPQDLTLVIGAVLVGRLQQLHREGFVHRDIKPENVVLRLAQNPDEGPVPCFLLVDFALATCFAETPGTHIDERRDADLVGTHRYMAIHAQQGVTQSRRSDLESLAYMLVYLARGQLPWQPLQPADMLKCKESTSTDELCAGLSPPFGRFVKECRELGFYDTPRYERLMRGLLEGVRGNFDFQAARVRQEFRQQLQEMYLQYEARCTIAKRLMLMPLADADAARFQTEHWNVKEWSQRVCAAAMPIFVRHESTEASNRENMATELCAYQPTCAADLDNPRNFFFEGYTMPLPGMQHIVVGTRHFFAFFQQWQAASALGRHAAVEQICVFSFGRRHMVVRAAVLPEYDVTAGGTYRDWNLRSAFWAQVILLPREM